VFVTVYPNLCFASWHRGAYFHHGTDLECRDGAVKIDLTRPDPTLPNDHCTQGKTKSGKRFDKKSAVTFHLVHRSQNDPLAGDRDASEMVLQPMGPALQSSRKSKRYGAAARICDTSTS